VAQWQYDIRSNGQSIDRGLGVRHHNISAEGKGINAKLFSQPPDAAEIGLWVYEIRSDFSVNGSRAQSANLRDFYPHNFVEPVLTVLAQVPTSYEYNRLSEFVRYTQKRAVTYDQRDLAIPVIKFVLQPRGSSRYRHQGLGLEGFIPRMPRGATRFQYAHDVQFDFVVTRSQYGLMRDEAGKANELLSWAQIVLIDPKSGYAYRPNTPGYDDVFEDKPTAVLPPDNRPKPPAPPIPIHPNP
jgi:hypothetical protein